MVSWRASGEPIMMTLLGGAGTIFGPFLGSGIVLLMRNTLSSITDNGSLFLGLLFVAVVLLFRRGILGEIVHHSVDRATSPDMPAKGELYAANPNQIATTGEVADA
ncbi:hypothetical protein [Mesorhizobium sp. M7A.F.Ca.US.001.04.2.1]